MTDDQGFTLHAGCSLRLEILVKDAAGSPAVLNGATAAWTLFDGARDLLEKSSAGGGGITIDTAASKVIIAATAAETAELLPGVYRHHCSLTLDGEKRPVAGGPVLVKEWRA